MHKVVRSMLSEEVFTLSYSNFSMYTYLVEQLSGLDSLLSRNQQEMSVNAELVLQSGNYDLEQNVGKFLA